MSRKLEMGSSRHLSRTKGVPGHKKFTIWWEDKYVCIYLDYLSECDKTLRPEAVELTHVIPALWEVKVGRLPEVRSSRPAWPT